MLFLGPIRRMDQKPRFDSPWTDERVEELRQLFAIVPPLSCQAMADRLELSYDTVKSKLERLRLRRQQDFWSADRVETLKRLHAEGHAFSDIAVEMGVTRNAVIGKAQRLKLPGRQEKMVEARFPKPRRPRRIQVRSAAEPAPQYVPPPIPADAPEPRNLTILDLAAADCRWAVTDGLPHAFCGHPVAGELPYCSYHARIAYQPSRPRR